MDIFDQIDTYRKGGDIFDVIGKAVPKQRTVFEEMRTRTGELTGEAERGAATGAAQMRPSLIAGAADKEAGRVVSSLHQLKQRKFTTKEIEEQTRWPERWRPGALEETVRRINRQPGPQELKDEETRDALRTFVEAEAGHIQSVVQQPYEAARWREEAEKLKGKFLAKRYRNLERGDYVVVGGALHLAEEITRIVSLGRKGGTLAEWADIYHDLLQTPEMQPVVENNLDKYLGGAVEMAPFLATTMLPGLSARAIGAIPTSISVLAGPMKALTPAANFLTAYGVESNLVYQGLKNQGYEETDARSRAVVAGLINAGIELRGGSGDKYLRQSTIQAATTKLGKWKYFGRKALRTALAEGLAEELPQEAVSMVLGSDVPYREDGKVDWGKVADRMIDTALMGTIMGGLVASPVVAAEAFSIPAWTEGQVVSVSPEKVNIPGRTYAEAAFRTNAEISGKNPWVKQTPSKTNKGRVLMIQFASDLLTEGKAGGGMARAYYDKLYANRPGYSRLGDTWEVPKWITEAAFFVPDSDVYFVRDVDEARQFLKSSGYDKVMFSALDVNTPKIKELIAGYQGRAVVGGYVGGAGAFSDSPNVTWYDSMPDMAKGEGYEYRAGVNLDHFEGSQTIPRLCLSKGCKHKCAFCVVPKNLEVTPEELAKQQVEAFGKLDAKLVYLDDKTFGQAPNYAMLPDLYWKIKEQNPEFEGFIIQTTAQQFDRFSDDFLTAAHIKYVELGVESYNDDILKQLHKPASEAKIDLAVARARRLRINVIPNIIIGLPQETAETYAHTLEWLEANLDVISHINIYNLALHKGTEMAESIGEIVEETDLNENAVAKSFHKDPQLHMDFANRVYELGSRALDKDAISKTGLTPDQEIAGKYGVEPGRVELLFKQAEDRYRELKAKPTADRKGRPVRIRKNGTVVPATGEHAELAFLSRSRNDIEAILTDLTGKDPVLSFKLKPKPDATRSKEVLLEMGHGIAQQLGLDEAERRLLMADLTGKSSMKQMALPEMEEFVQYLEELLKERGETYEPKPAAYYEMLDQLRNRERPDRIDEVHSVRDYLAKVKEHMQRVAWSPRRLDRVAEWLDGDTEDGWFKRTFYRPIVAANAKNNNDIDRDVRLIDDFFESLGANPGEMLVKEDQINDHLKLSAFDRIGYFMLWQNEHGKAWLEQMGVTQQDIVDIYEFMGGKDSKEAKIAEYMFDYSANWWPLLKRVAISVGVDEKQLQQEFLYAPIILTRKNGAPLEPGEQVGLADLFNEMVFKHKGAKPEQRFMEQRRGPAKGFKIETNALLMFFNMSSRFNTFVNMAPPAYTISRMLSDTQFGQALNQATNGVGVELWSDWLRHAVQGHGDRTNSVVIRDILALRNSGIFYAIGWNLPSVERQAVGTLNSLSNNPRMLRYYARVVTEAATGGYKAMYEDSRSRSRFLSHRTLEEVLRRRWTPSELKKRYGKNAEISDTSMSLLKDMDLRTNTLTWTALYRMKLAEGKSEADAALYADEWHEKTQEVGETVYLPDIMRTGPLATMYKILAPFTNAVNNQLNLYMHDNIRPIRQRGAKGIPLSAYRYLMTWAIPAIVFGWIKRGRLQDDPKELAVDLAEYPAATLLFVGDALMYAITGESYRADLYETGFVSAAQMVRAASKGNVRSAIKNAGRTAAIFVGALHPKFRGAITSQTIRSAEAGWDMLFSDEPPPAKSLIIGEYAAKKAAKEEKKETRRIVK